MADIVPFLKRYSLPLLLLSLAIFFQLFVIPSAFPPSHYDVLGIKQFGSVEEVTEAYQKFTYRWSSGIEVPKTFDFVKIRYAFELLSNLIWKRDYDRFGIDEHLHVLNKAKGLYDTESFSNVKIPLLDAFSDPTDHAFNILTVEDFVSTIGNNKTWLIQVYSSGSTRCAQFSSSWKRIASLLDGVASTGMVELGESQLATYLAERRSTGQPFFRNGLPSLVAFPQGCRSTDCLVRYQEDLSVDAVVDWIATSMHGLPRILYYTKESLRQNFIVKSGQHKVKIHFFSHCIVKSGQHKVKVIFFSKTGERAAPFLRQAAKDYWAYASFAFVLWREEESSVWWNTFGVESAPAVVFLKDPGSKPVVYHGAFNSSWFFNVMEQNKNQDLPQLRSVTSMELGCDARGYSRAGNSTMTWYCVILAGRTSLELGKMRETIRRVQDVLNDVVSNPGDKDNFSLAQPAANALAEKRLTFTWLDGEAQKQYCFFYLHSEDSYQTCGPRRYEDPTDLPQLFIVRYQRNSTKDESKVEKKRKTIWDSFEEVDTNLASQLVARYNGSMDISEIAQWISNIIKDGDSRDLPFFTTKSAELSPEDADPVWLKGAQGVMSTSKGMKHKIQGIVANIYDRMKDPKLGPIFLLGACMSLGSIWLQKSQTTQPSKTTNRSRGTTSTTPNSNPPSSITDVEPKDARQILSTDSDSE
ncbi:DNAJ heat shock N-terminal domain-containing protein isoform X2 [Tasmannia lanceolata]|uniref:DNAJ heat shock N-terminal domain-containing protein isoform X2 n=1 Tax=Tasmannia lanceolata TaxID=3420 RepID=UPI0040642951